MNRRSAHYVSLMVTLMPVDLSSGSYPVPLPPVFKKALTTCLICQCALAGDTQRAERLFPRLHSNDTLKAHDSLTWQQRAILIWVFNKNQPLYNDTSLRAAPPDVYV